MAIRLSSGSRRNQHQGELRPTAARTLDAVFDLLNGEIAERRVLDLFCGVGSYGILALKRGAAGAVLVDNSRESARRAQREVDRYHLESQAQIWREDVFHFLHNAAQRMEPFDIVFADPPYELVSPSQILAEIVKSRVLASGGVLVLEHSKRQAPPDMVGLKLRKSRVFGETTISIWDSP